MSTVDNIAVLKWVAEQDKMGKGKEAVRQIYKAYETESNGVVPFFKPVGAASSPEVTPEWTDPERSTARV